MADHSKPTTSSTYSNFVSELDSRLDDITLGLDPANVTATNVPTNAIRWSSASNTWQKWNGTTWGNLSTTYALTSITASGSLTVDGNTTLGNASTDTVTVNGYMGVGGAPNANRAVSAAISAGPTATTGVYGVYSSPTRTSAGNDTNFAAYNALPAINATALTVTSSDGLYVNNATLTAGTLTNQHGVRVADLTSGTNNYGITSLVSSGANKWNIYASGTADNYFAGNLGIGTSSPSGKLHVAVTTAGDTSLSLQRIGSSRFEFQQGIVGVTGDALFLKDTTLSRDYLALRDGNVGIGTTSPAYKLDVSSSGDPTTTSGSSALVLRNTVSGRLGLIGVDDSQNLIIWDSTFSPTTGNGAIKFLNGGGSGTERMRIDSSGNVGIGTSSPSNSARLDAAGSVISTAATLGTFNANNAGFDFVPASKIGRFYATSTDTTGGVMTFTTGQNGSYAERMRLDSSGNVGIGTSSTTRRFEVFGLSGSDCNVEFRTNKANGLAQLLFTNDARTWVTRISSTDTYEIVDSTAAATRMTIDSSGNVGIGVTPSAWDTSFKAMQLGAGGYISGRTNTDEVYVGANAYFDTTNSRWEYIANDVATQYYQDAGAHVWRTATSGTAGNAITFTQAMTLDASGRLLVGTTASRANLISSGSRLQIEDTSSGAAPSFIRNSNDTAAPFVVIGKSRGTTVGSFTAVVSGDQAGGISFEAADGTALQEAARITGVVDGAVSAGIVPGRLLFSTTSSTGSITERARINSAGITQFNSNIVMPYQGAPTSKAAAATLTGAELITGILNTTGTTYTVTLPTGTDIEGALSWSANNVALDWWVINTASGTITIGANGNTTLGSLTIATGTSAHFRIRRTAANTFTVYRLG